MDINAGGEPGSGRSSSNSTEPLVAEDTADAAIVQPRIEPPTGPEQLNTVIPMGTQRMRAGDTWYVIDRKWYRRWQAACGDAAAEKEQGNDEIKVGPIDNTVIAHPHTGALLRPVTEGQDVEYVPEEAWYILMSWYGCIGQPVKRSIFQAADGPKLELFPPTYHVSKVVPANSPSLSRSAVHITASAGSTIGDLKKQVAHAVGLNASGAIYRIWHVSNSIETLDVTADRLANAEMENAEDDTLIESSTLRDGDHIALEQADTNGTWLVGLPVETQTGPMQPTPPDSPIAKPTALFGGPSFVDKKQAQHNVAQPKRAILTNQGSTVASTSAGAADIRVTRSQTGSSGKRGLVGLTNLGNTCFMNSALQCLSNTPSLQHYFQTGFYKTELNPENPLGMHGELAKAFGTLIEQLWAGGSSSVTPRHFKQILSKFAPAFSGWQQHDSQELIAFLLDGLHEDLNRIRKKPYDEVPDWNGGGDAEELALANTSWELYKRRNDSVIVDLFQGQYRSRLTCPECGKIAIKFDPFMYLSLAIPSKKKWTGQVTLVPDDPGKLHIKISLELPFNATFKTLKIKIGEMSGYDPARLFAVEEYSAKIFKLFNDSDTVSSIQPADLVMLYEVPFEISQPKYRPPSRKSAEEEGKYFVTVVHSKSSSIHAGSFPRSDILFGHPFVIGFTPAEVRSAEAIERKICKRLASYQKVGPKVWASSNADVVGLEESADVATSTPSSARQIVRDDDDDEPPSRSAMAQLNLQPNSAWVNITVPGPSAYSSGTSFCGAPPSCRVTLAQRRLAVLAARSQSTQQPATIDEDSDNLYDDDVHADASTTVLHEAESSDLFPILSNGELVTVEWSPQAATEAFGNEHDTRPNPEHWSPTESLVEPALAERKRQASGDGKDIITSIDDLLDEFVKEEKLTEDNTWYCPACKKHQQAQKKFDLWKMPDVLVIHLKRFSNERAFRDKIDILIDFPIEGLELSERVEGQKVAKRLRNHNGLSAEPSTTDDDESLIYDLFAVDNHYGGLGGGHYTAYAKNIVDGKWHNFDDSRVSSVSNPESVKTPAAYLLFYRRRTEKPIGGKTHEILSSRTVSPAMSAIDGEEGGNRNSGHSFRTNSGSNTSHFFQQQFDVSSGSGIRQFGRLHHDSDAEPNIMFSHMRDDTDNDGVGDFSTASGTRNMPSPNVSDDEGNFGDFAKDKPQIVNGWNGGVHHSHGGTPPHLEWSADCDSELPNYSNDEVMEISPPKTPPVVEIKIQPDEVSRAAATVTMSQGTTEMDELE